MSNDPPAQTVSSPGSETLLALDSSLQPAPTGRLIRAADLLAAGVGMMVLIPVTALAAAVQLAFSLIDPAERGSLYYREQRMSEGRPFDLLKFRVLKRDVLEKARRESGYIKQYERDPTNMTRLGRVLHKTYLDELPQLWNIVRGEMSLVGPRPYAIADYQADRAKGYRRKDLARAGLTGLVQSKKGIEGLNEIELDYEFLSNISGLSPARRTAYHLRILRDSVRVLLEAKGI